MTDFRLLISLQIGQVSLVRQAVADCLHPHIEYF